MAMFGRNKHLKYIKIKGRLTDHGVAMDDQVDGKDMYVNAIVTDSAGNAVKFSALTIPVLISRALREGVESTFYIQRYRRGEGKLLGMIYAIEVNGEKTYDPDVAKGHCLSFGRGWSIRLRALSNPVVWLNVVLGGGGIVGIVTAALLYGMLGGLAILMGIAAAVGFWYALGYPLFKNATYVGLAEMRETMKSEGFLKPAFALPAQY